MTLEFIKNWKEQKFDEGGFLLVNKPLTWTSFDAVNKIKWLLKGHYQKKVKVGHSGTLDPLATGLLIICTGKFTKKLTALTGLDKSYDGTITVGSLTPSFDLETEPEQFCAYNHITEKDILEAKESLTGDLKQLPPIYSAIKQDGVPLYKKARRGELVEVHPRLVTVHKFDITKTNLPEIHFDISCSKGTYIRSLAHDFGKKLKIGGHLSALRRTKIGKFGLENAISIEEFEEFIKSQHQKDESL